jgi:hypothetical protein
LLVILDIANGVSLINPLTVLLGYNRQRCSK